MLEIQHDFCDIIRPVPKTQAEAAGPLFCTDSVTGTEGASASLRTQPTCTEHLLRARCGDTEMGKEIPSREEADQPREQ